MCSLSQDAIDDVLKEGRIFEVGGAVRDRFMEKGRLSKDRDYLVTGVPYDDLTRILKPHGRVDLVGRSFGVIKFTQYKKGIPHTFDITLPRKEHSTGIGHKDFSVSFDPFLKVEEDLLRRDFTVNAMALALDNQELVDPLHGRADLDKRMLRMVYDDSFKDDPLRMLRAVQFAARFKLIIEPRTFEAMREHAHLIGSVSAERIAEELNKLLELAEHPSEGFRLMQTSGLLTEILPELEICVNVDQPGGYHKYDVFEHTMHIIDECRPDLKLRLAALFHDICKPQHKRPVDGGATFYGHESGGSKTASRVMRRLRYSNDLIDDVVMLVERHMFTTDVTDKGLRRLVRRVGVPLIFDLLDLRRADVVAQGMGGTTEDVDEFESNIRAELEKKPPFSISDLKIDGDQIMAMFGIGEGPTVGKILDYLMDQVLDDPLTNTSERLEELARAYYMKIAENGINISDEGSSQ